jgi:hypothetical protein
VAAKRANSESQQGVGEFRANRASWLLPRLRRDAVWILGLLVYRDAAEMVAVLCCNWI